MEIKDLLLAVTGSIGVLSIPNYIHNFRQNSMNVIVIMSHASQKFITSYTMRLFSGNEVFTDSFEFSDDIAIPHLELTRKCDLFLIMPATANIISKLANGLCDDLISTAALASRAPVVLIPNMNIDMWNSKANQRNLYSLRELGYFVFDKPQKSKNKHAELVDLEKINIDKTDASATIPDFDTLFEFIKEIRLKK